MNLHKFYEEVEGDISKYTNWENEKETEKNIDTLIKLHKELSYYKLVIKKLGVSHIYKLAKVDISVTCADILDWVQCKEYDYFAFITCIAKETGVDPLKITSWLNTITLEEGFNKENEKKALFRLVENAELLYKEKRSYHNIAF